MEKDIILQKTQKWLEDIVIGLNLCPFAKKPFVSGQVRMQVSEATTGESLTKALLEELNHLNEHPSTTTTLLIHPYFLEDFDEYLGFVDFAENLLVEIALDGIIQIASFHPDYYFDGVGVDDVSNYTNRSPYPILHLIREDSISEAVASYPNIDEVPLNNIRTMEKLGFKNIKEMWKGIE